MLLRRRAERIAQRADAWVVRSSGPLGPEEIAERDEWRRADPAHEQAWQRAQALWTATDGMQRPAEAPVARSSYGRPSRLAIASVAAVIAAGGLAVIDLRMSRPVPASNAWRTANAARDIHLPDGSTVRLGAESAIRVNFSGRARSLLLESGDARFTVAHDASHPFVVTAGDRTVTAVGTVFDVSVDRQAVSVTLYEGVVDVASRNPAGAARPTRLHHGQHLIAHGQQQDVSPAPSTVGDSRVRDFDPTPVAQILDDANRGAVMPIRLADPALAKRRIEGRFDLSDSSALAEQIAAALGVTVTREAGAYVLGTLPTVSR